MESLEHFIKANIVVIKVVSGIVVTLVTLTSYSYSNFATKDEVKNSIQNQREIITMMEKNFDKLDAKMDSVIMSRRSSECDDDLGPPRKRR